MKVYPSLLTLLLCTGSFVSAQGPHGGRPLHHEPAFVEKHDTDGDGRLSREERMAAREQMRGLRPHDDERKGVSNKGSRKGPRDSERHKKMLERFDTDGDGKLSREERDEARKSLKSRLGDFGEKKHQRMLKEFDVDGDGKLSEVEREKVRKVMRARRDQADGYLKKVKQKVMGQFDTDADSKLSAAEMEKAKAHFSAEMKKMRQDLVSTYDRDGDGKLSHAEHKAAHTAERKVMLERFDTDGDGVLSEAEKKAAFDAMLEDDPYRLMHMLMGKKTPEKNGQSQHRRGHKRQHAEKAQEN